MLYSTQSNLEMVSTDSDYISRETIHKMANELSIFQRYIGQFKLGRPFKSPLRQDKNPSFSIFVSKKENTLLYKDLATGDCGDVFKFVKELYGINTYADVYKKIYEDISGMKFYSVSERPAKLYYKKPTKITVKRKPFSIRDIEFWKQYGISVETLNRYKVNAISACYINDSLYKKYSINEPMYSYKIFNKFKIYRPFSNKADKWRGNLSSLDMQGYEQLQPSSSLLIITKSLKDVMTLRELGYEAIAPPSETVAIPKIVVDTLTNFYTKIILLYDRDVAGMKFTRKMVEKYKFDFMFINKKYKTKDISDFVKKYGKKTAKDLLLDILNNK